MYHKPWLCVLQCAPPSDVCWFITPMNTTVISIHIYIYSITNHSEIGVINQLNLALLKHSYLHPSHGNPRLAQRIIETADLVEATTPDSHNMAWGCRACGCRKNVANWYRWPIEIDPIGSMYAIYGNIYHQYTPNVSIYTSTMDPMGMINMMICRS